MDIQGIDIDQIKHHSCYFIHKTSNLLVEAKYFGQRYVVVEELHFSKSVENVHLVTKFLSEYKLVGMGASILTSFYKEKENG